MPIVSAPEPVHDQTRILLLFCMFGAGSRPRAPS